MRKSSLSFIIGLVLIILQACSSKRHTPVSDLSYLSSPRGIRGAGKASKPTVYRVVKGDTLLGIAWRFDLDYRKLAAANSIGSPYFLSIGKKLRLSEYTTRNVRKISQKNTVNQKNPPSVPNRNKSASKIKSNGLSSNKSQYSTISNNDKGWLWPVKDNNKSSSIIQRFSSQAPISKGLDIRGLIGTDIVSTRSGKVAYAGSKLKGYGKLIIIKHSGNFLSAYAHNNVLFVKEGQWVKQGQKIAELGNSGTQQAKLHFEIRRLGKPVNPLIYLKKR